MCDTVLIRKSSTVLIRNLPQIYNNGKSITTKSFRSNSQQSNSSHFRVFTSLPAHYKHIADILQNRKLDFTSGLYL